MSVKPSIFFVMKFKSNTFSCRN